MAERTNISWCERTWSPWVGCTKVSPACDGCYAAHLMDHRLGRVGWGPHGERRRTSVDYWRQPLAWDRAAKAAGQRSSVFPSLCDPFDKQADPVIRREFFELIQETSWLDWLLLTKRPQNIVDMVEAIGFLPPNVAFGATVEDQKRGEINLLPLLEAAFRLNPAFVFVSCEPLLALVNLRRIKVGSGIYLDALTGSFSAEATFSGRLADYQAGLDALPPLPGRRPKLGWVISGGETSQGKHKARPSHPAWFRSLRDQCAATATPFHHKQNGEWLNSIGQSAGAPFTWVDGLQVSRVGKKIAGRLLDGVEHNGMPKATSAPAGAA